MGMSFECAQGTVEEGERAILVNESLMSASGVD